MMVLFQVNRLFTSTYKVLILKLKVLTKNLHLKELLLNPQAVLLQTLLIWETLALRLLKKKVGKVFASGSHLKVALGMPIAQGSYPKVALGHAVRMKELLALESYPKVALGNH